MSVWACFNIVSSSDVRSREPFSQAIQSGACIGRGGYRGEGCWKAAILCQASLASGCRRQEAPWPALHGGRSGGGLGGDRPCARAGNWFNLLPFYAASLSLEELGPYEMVRGSVKNKIQLNKRQRAYWLCSVTHESDTIQPGRYR